MLQYGINEILKKTLNSGHSRYVLGIYKMITIQVRGIFTKKKKNILALDEKASDEF